MLEKQTNPETKMSPSNKCSCCPYGFHIDRDFVRYCDTLYNSAQLDKLRLNKRERRKEKKTVESYLGLGSMTSPSQEPSQQKLYKVLQDVEAFPKKSATLPFTPTTMSYSSSTLPHNFANDGYENAMQDFEDTWQKSLRRSSSSSEIILAKRNGVKPLFYKSTAASVEDQKQSSTVDGPVRSRNSSTSSVSSQSTVFSTTSLPITSELYHDQHSFDMMTTSMDSSLSKSHVFSPNRSSVVNKTILTNIREQMATSLERMKELEEQVKTIPVLEVKLYALAEEKKSLLNQLKEKNSNVEKTPENQHILESQLKRLENEGIMSPTFTRKCLSARPRGNDLSSPSIVASSSDKTIFKSISVQKQKDTYLGSSDSKSKPNVTPKVMKNTGTSCSVLTRDVGVSYVPHKLKSVGVGSDITFQDLIKSYTNKKGYDQFASVSSESLDSDSESLGGSDEQSRTFIRSRLRKTLPSSYKTSSIPIKTSNSATNTPVKYHLNKYVNTEETLSKPVVKPIEKLTFHKSTSAVPSLSTKSVQTYDRKTFRTIGLQTFEVKSPDKHVTKRDASVGDYKVDDVLCAACSKPKKSVGVGDVSIKSVVCDRCSSFWPQSNSGLHSSSNCENCVLRQTETIAVGDYDVNQVDCQNCEHVKFENLEKIKNNSVGINTTLDSSSNLNVSKSDSRICDKCSATIDIHICDKCSATIQSLAQGFAANTTPDSKIPRPSSLKISLPGKTNHTKLAKLRTQVSKTQKNIENAVEVSSSSVEKQGGVAQTNKSAISKLNVEYRKITKERNNSTDSSPLSKSPTRLPDFTNLPSLPHKKKELSKEVKAACKVLNDYLQKPDRGGEKKTLSSLTIIQNEWFKVANQKKADPLLIEDYLDTFEEFSKLLLNKVVNLSDNNGNTALHYAISYGNFDVVSILIDSKVCDVNKKNKAGYTSIMLVALADMKNDTHHYVVQRLFNIGDINSKATQNGQTALMLAVSHGKRDIVKILLDAGAEVNLQDKDGSTALMCGAEHGHLEIVRMLLAHPECDPTLVDNDDCNALTIAMEAGHKDIGLLIYTNMNFSRGSSPYSTLKNRKRSTPRSTPPPRTPTLRTPPLPSPSARSTNSIPSSFQFPS
ncbi:hypothetical protein JTE90_021450 [Oedothorax gibbosus]|uniref:KN motif and ankyrin repeat domain-containing protein 1 n=1 Tax=Oedothorax gibbosus TaxID=931172 RepID=A0AAV6VZ80_9ARAC|nr:hypothetical protein JTE90_021450 [Oedothorax gibbosus]